MAITNAEYNTIRALVCDVVYRIVNRNASDDPGNDGKLTREGMKTAADQQAQTY